MTRARTHGVDRIEDQTEWRDGCLEWTGGVDRHGHGKINHEGVWWSTHKLVWTTRIGPIEEGMVVHHMCENKRCVNIAHLQLLTHAAHTAHHNAMRAARRRKAKA